MTSIRPFALLACLSMASSAWGAEKDAAPDVQQIVRIAYVEIQKDVRYAQAEARGGITFRTSGRPWAGAQLGIADANQIGRLLHVQFKLDRRTAAAPQDLGQAVSTWLQSGPGFVLADLPADALATLATTIDPARSLVFNVSATSDRLRAGSCNRSVFHTIPSDSMRTDAMLQYLVTKRWRDILVLQGSSAADEEEVAALKRSAAKFGGRIVAVRPFTLARDPAHRDENNLALLTGDATYDVVYVADHDGEFARQVPYATALPRPVVGDAGLSAHAWSWTWDRNGAPQLQHRFEKASEPLRMNDAEWAAWVAIKALATAALHGHSASFAELRNFISSPDLVLDTVKGRPGSFRTWDHQLRQPMLLASDTAVVATAPLSKFLHAKDVLDTVGVDEAESTCHFH